MKIQMYDCNILLIFIADIWQYLNWYINKLQMYLDITYKLLCTNYCL